MSGGEIRKVSPEEIQMVQNLIEQCLPHYMTKKQVIDIIYQQQKIEPSFTHLVWQKLEEQNEEFFRGYYLRLMLKEQIAEFNKLLDRQVTLMHQVGPTATRAAFQPMPNGSRMTPTMPQNAACYASENPAIVLKMENMQHPIATDLPSGFTNASIRTGLPPNMLVAQNSNGGMMHGMNGVPIKTEAGGYLGDPRFVFGADVRAVEACGDTCLSPFSSLDSDSHPLNGSLVDDTSSFGAFGQMSNNFDILESFSTPAFLSSVGDNFLDSHGSTVDHQAENNGLEDISQIMRYEDFGRNNS